MVNLFNWVWGLFPPEYNKDHGDNQLLQRFLSAILQEPQDTIIPKLENVWDFFDAELIEEPLLVHFAELFGNPPNMLGGVPYYRKLLRNLPIILKHKGTKLSYDYLLGLFGVTITITEDSDGEYRYDAGYNHDSEVTLHYDEICPPCSGYQIVVQDPTESSLVLKEAFEDPDKYRQLIHIIQFIEPINARLTSLTYEGTQTLPQGWWVLTTGIWDSSKYWDNSKYYKNLP